jgi:hypothetical protein
MINSVHQNAIFLANVRNAAVDRNTILAYHAGVLVGHASDSVSVTNNRWWLGYHNTIPSDAVFAKVDPAATNVRQAGNFHDAKIAHYQMWSHNNIPPTASFDLANGTRISSPTPITVTTTDQGTGIARVYFFVDGVPQGHCDTAPYSFAFDPGRYTAGSHELAARAVDRFANPSTESRVRVQVDVSARAGTVRLR